MSLHLVNGHASKTHKEYFRLFIHSKKFKRAYTHVRCPSEISCMFSEIKKI